MNMSDIYANCDVEILAHVTASDFDTRWRNYVKSYLRFKPVSRKRLDIYNNQSQKNHLLTNGLSSNVADCVNAHSNLEITTQSNQDSKVQINVGTECFYLDSCIYHPPNKISFENQTTQDSSGTSVDPHPSNDIIESSQPPTDICSRQLPPLEAEDFQIKPCNTKKVLKKTLTESFSNSDQTHTSEEAPSNHGQSPEAKKPKIDIIDSINSSQFPLCTDMFTSTAYLEDPRSSSSFDMVSGISSQMDTNCFTPPSQRPIVDYLGIEKQKETLELTIFRDEAISSTSNKNQNSKVGHWSEALEIRPPPPEVGSSTLTPTMLITPSLRILAERSQLERNFKPQKLTRDLRPMERGYWRVLCSSWDHGLRIRCWNCLGTYIEKDNSAGWGVSCIRDKNLDEIRVYSWGIIIGHIYQLLWIASEGKINKTSPIWVDADGQEIVKM